MNGKKSSVLVLHEHRSNSIILTERSHELRHHPGEVCFPGGLWEVGDESLYQTALRELEEELGINADRVKFNKQLNTEHTLTGYLIYPWFAEIESIIPYTLNTQEVASIFPIPMAEVCNPKNYQLIEVNRHGIQFFSYQFIADSHFIWGATVRIMMQLCSD